MLRIKTKQLGTNSCTQVALTSLKYNQFRSAFVYSNFYLEDKVVKTSIKMKYYCSWPYLSRFICFISSSLSKYLKVLKRSEEIANYYSELHLCMTHGFALPEPQISSLRCWYHSQGQQKAVFLIALLFNNT